VRTGEAAAGIERVQREGWFGAEHPLSVALQNVQGRYGAQTYAGSPMIAANLLRDQDSLHFAELHPQEHAALANVMSAYEAKVYKQDGYEMAQSILPPTPRRGMLLIDPSYEVKSEYDRLPGMIAKLHRKWNVGVIALWYPILTDGRHKPMVDALKKQNLAKAVCHEVRFPAARKGHRMIGSGMFFVNAPFGLSDETKQLDAMFARIEQN